jgi:hypothetical protein
MVTSAQLFKKFGAPEHEHNMCVLDIPEALDLDHIPRKVYCNKDIAQPLLSALTNISKLQLGHLIKTWDGCFNIRRKVGSSSQSLHSWGYAVDINAAWNRYGKHPTMPPEIIQCFKEAGFDWGGTWITPDGMHFQLRGLT